MVRSSTIVNTGDVPIHTHTHTNIEWTKWQQNQKENRTWNTKLNSQFVNVCYATISGGSGGPNGSHKLAIDTPAHTHHPIYIMVDVDDDVSHHEPIV